MDASVTIAVLSMCGTIGAAWVAARASTKASRIKAETDERMSAREAEAKAYERARETYDALLEDLREELARTREHVERIETQSARLAELLAAEQDTSHTLRVQVRNLREQIAGLEAQIRQWERRVADLRRQLVEAGLTPVEEVSA